MNIPPTVMKLGHSTFGPDAIKLFSCLTQMSMNCKQLINICVPQLMEFLGLNCQTQLFILLINFKMPTKFNMKGQDKFHTQLS